MKTTGQEKKEYTFKIKTIPFPLGRAEKRIRAPWWLKLWRIATL